VAAAAIHGDAGLRADHERDRLTVVFPGRASLCRDASGRKKSARASERTRNDDRGAGRARSFAKSRHERLADAKCITARVVASAHVIASPRRRMRLRRRYCSSVRPRIRAIFSRGQGIRSGANPDALLSVRQAWYQKSEHQQCQCNHPHRHLTSKMCALDPCIVLEEISTWWRATLVAKGRLRRMVPLQLQTQLTRPARSDAG